MPDETQPRFEDALAQIEKIVADLERGEPALITALGKYENGVKLLRQCYQLLEEAENSVALLTGTDEQGNPLTAPFDASATLASEPAAAAAPAAGREPKPKPPERSTGSRARSPSRDEPSEIPEAPF
ncbi:MAG: exodeoxyribonuclease VII small subunit [Isosphaeraceae bacterium]